MFDCGLSPVSFMSKAVASIRLKALYSEGMSLVEETSRYFEKEGRFLTKTLPRDASVLYTSESVRLTTRLMQMASWLLLQRALYDGEMSLDQVLAEKKKIRFSSLSSDCNTSGWSGLPVVFKDLLGRSLRLQKRIMLIDREIYESDKLYIRSNVQNNVRAQINLLEACFNKI